MSSNDILDMYIYETNSLLEQLETIVLDAEKENTFSQDNVNEIFRIMHTIKGSSAMMEFDTLATVSHRIEDMFFLIREGTMSVVKDADRPALFDVMLHAVDYFREEMEKVEAEEPLNKDVDSFLANINSLIAKIKGEEPEEAPAAPRPRPEDLGELCTDEKAQQITAFLTGLLEHMECRAQVKVYMDAEGRYKVILEGEKLGALIGRRGETLDAIQQLTSYTVNRGQSKRVRIHVDAEGYRAKREESLQRLAVKVAGKVVKYRKNMTLEPMNAYERHVIHTALQDYPGVSTFSTGTEPNRRTVVAYDPGKK